MTRRRLILGAVAVAGFLIGFDLYCAQQMLRIRIGSA